MLFVIILDNNEFCCLLIFFISSCCLLCSFFISSIPGFENIDASDISDNVSVLSWSRVNVNDLPKLFTDELLSFCGVSYCTSIISLFLGGAVNAASSAGSKHNIFACDDR